MRVPVASSLLLRATLVATAMAAAAAAAAGAAGAPNAPPAAAGAAGGRGTVLVSWSFDDPVDTGPDTLRVFQNARGRVSLSPEFRVSGFTSVELTDVPGDHDFPELQGFFPLARNGRLALAFALLTTDPSQELNVALAGPGWFTLEPDGIAFWLSTRDGWLFHTSDSIPKKLLPMTPFVWYRVFVDYDIQRGTYDLTISLEGKAEPIVALRGQTNAGAHPGSGVNLFSFIGDNGDDLSAVTYYVDDVIVATDRDVVLPAFVAPGRRRFFVDLLAPPAAAGRLPLRCPAAIAPADLGLGAAEVARLQAAKLLPRVAAWAHDEGAAAPPPGAAELRGLPPEAAAVAAWRYGCSLLGGAGKRRDPTAAEEALRRAVELAPAAPLLRLSWTVALAGTSRWAEADAQLASLPQWQEDPRLLLVAATVAARRGDPQSALDWLAAPAGRDFGARRDTVVLRHWFYLLLAVGRHDEAARAAATMAGALADPAAAAAWREREGDADFALRRLDEARAAYVTAGGAKPPTDVLLKLADVAFLLGDATQERTLRESVYGRLAAQ
jgi:hypothetical protein